MDTFMLHTHAEKTLITCIWLGCTWCFALILQCTVIRDHVLWKWILSIWPIYSDMFEVMTKCGVIKIPN